MIDILQAVQNLYGLAIIDPQLQDLFLAFLVVCLFWMLCAFISGKAPADDTLTQLITGCIFAWAALTLYKMFPRLKDVFIDTLFIGCIAFAAQFFRLFMQRFGAWLERPKHEVKDDEHASPEEKP